MPRYLLTADADHGARLGAVVLGGHVSVREWGDEWVVFDGMSGDCHVFSAACGAVLGELLNAPNDGLDQSQLFAAAFGDETAPSDAEMATLLDALAKLQQLGMVRVCGE